MNTKTITIGRESDNAIVLNDPSSITSRHHAVLTISPTGKMTIMDRSANGTYVNGQKILSNVPFPVTRDDTVNFAHAVTLDWNRVPKSRQWLTAIIIAFAVAVIAALLIILLPKIHREENNFSDNIGLSADSTKCTISFNANGGEGNMEPQLVVIGSSTGIIANTFTREHYEFAGWNTEADGKGICYDDKATVTFSKNAVTLYAQWKERTYMVTFIQNSRRVAGEMLDFKVTEGQNTVLPANKYTRKDYRFKGWNTESNGKGVAYADRDTVNLTNDIRLYAQWEEIKSIDPKLESAPAPATDSLPRRALL